MTLKETARICATIRNATFAWRNQNEAEFTETIKVWYECLKDEPFDMGMSAVIEYIRQNSYPPTVADVYKPYKEYKENQKALRSEYNDIYYSAISHYPCYQDTQEERTEFDRITGKSVSNARKLARQIEEYVRDKEMNHGCMPVLINYLKGLKKIE